jgi:hypothetical protein
MRFIAVFLILLLLGFSTLQASAGGGSCDVQEGCLGRIRIGDSLAAVETLIGRKLELQFAGDGRAGVSLASDQNTRRLGIALTSESSTADIFFVTRTPQPVVDMISLQVSCEYVQRLRKQAEVRGIATRGDAKGGWRVDDKKEPREFVWGADTAPVCRFWLRGTVLRR